MINKIRAALKVKQSWKESRRYHCLYQTKGIANPLWDYCHDEWGLFIFLEMKREGGGEIIGMPSNGGKLNLFYLMYKI